MFMISKKFKEKGDKGKFFCGGGEISEGRPIEKEIRG